MCRNCNKELIGGTTISDVFNVAESNAARNSKILFELYSGSLVKKF